MYEEANKMNSKMKNYSKSYDTEDKILVSDDDLLLMLKEESSELGYMLTIRANKFIWYDYNYCLVAEYNKEQILARLYELADEQNHVIADIRKHIRVVIKDLIQNYTISNK